MNEDRVPSILVLGMGNILLQDEGIGVRALERLMDRYCLPTEVRTLDGGTMGLDLLPYLEEASSLLILDAVQTGRPPGSLVRLEGAQIPAALAIKLSVHQVGFQELLAASLFRGTLPPRLVLWGIEPGSLDWGLDLSYTVAAALDPMVTAAVQELRGWGAAIRPVEGAAIRLPGAWQALSGARQPEIETDRLRAAAIRVPLPLRSSG